MTHTKLIDGITTEDYKKVTQVVTSSLFPKERQEKEKTKHQGVAKSLSQWGSFTGRCDLLGPACTSDGGTFLAGQGYLTQGLLLLTYRG